MGDVKKETDEQQRAELHRQATNLVFMLAEWFDVKPSKTAIEGAADVTFARLARLIALRQPDTSEGGGYIDPDTDQYVGPFTRCVCGNKRLALKGKFWCCTKCGGSWGENAGPAKTVAPPLNKSPTPEHVEGDVSVGEICEKIAAEMSAGKTGRTREWMYDIAKEAAELALAASRLSQAGVRVKPLEWRRDHIRNEWHGNVAPGTGHGYLVKDDGRWCTGPARRWVLDQIGDVDAAQAACFADYETRIRSALSGDTP